jgi:hypothetical protein
VGDKQKLRHKKPRPANLNGDMNTPATAPAVNSVETTRLVSLLTLAAGAVSLPQSGQADIIYTDLDSSPVVVGYGAGVDSFLFNLPGTASFGFQRMEDSTSTYFGASTIYYRTVLAGDQGGGAAGGIRADANGFVAPVPFGASWSQGGVGTMGAPYNAAVGVVNDIGGRLPASGYEHQYLAWVFSDSTQAGAPRYGWVEISLALYGYNAGGPNVTIFGYAYDNTGAKPTMGQPPVPEPTSGALLVMGAMALGARGLRKWRQQREAASQAA